MFLFKGYVQLYSVVCFKTVERLFTQTVHRNLTTFNCLICHKYLITLYIRHSCPREMLMFCCWSLIITVECVFSRTRNVDFVLLPFTRSLNVNYTGWEQEEWLEHPEAVEPRVHTGYCFRTKLSFNVEELQKLRESTFIVFLQTSSPLL